MCAQSLIREKEKLYGSQTPLWCKRYVVRKRNYIGEISLKLRFGELDKVRTEFNNNSYAKTFFESLAVNILIIFITLEETNLLLCDQLHLVIIFLILFFKTISESVKFVRNTHTRITSPLTKSALDQD